MAEGAYTFKPHLIVLSILGNYLKNKLINI